ncbi:MAG: hypothetical protein LBU77_00820 [Clostridiales bacterium]|jgi:hypothetical protein|nr:hypothetical protein [Clostridiales bacterium]
MKYTQCVIAVQSFQTRQSAQTGRMLEVSVGNFAGAAAANAAQTFTAKLFAMHGAPKNRRDKISFVSAVFDTILI